jgi:hypothetical protein
VYRDPELRLAVSRAVALETSRGWRITKEKASHKIDVVVALAMATLGAVQQGQAPAKFEYISVCGGGDGTPTAMKLRTTRLAADVCLAVALGDASGGLTVAVSEHRER